MKESSGSSSSLQKTLSHLHPYFQSSAGLHIFF